MASPLALLPLVAPLGLVLAAAVAWRTQGPRPRRSLAAATVATWLALALAAVAAASLAVAGPATSPLLGAAGLGLSVRLDPLSVTLALLVAFIGVVVVRYSRHYLEGDPRQGAFVGRLCLALAAVLLLVLSGNLAQLLLAWVATGRAVGALLGFYPDRPRARRAAARHRWVSRVGDLALLGAVLLLGHAFGTLDLAALATAAGRLAGGPVPAPVAVAVALVIVAALIKSGQLPTHGWLPQVAEAPTPVSALLHAGIVNGGGFLVIRLAPVMVLYRPALLGLAVVAGASAVVASAVMLTQQSVKAGLAWSTVAQMGFMLVECGIGAFAAAALHIVAHSFYKAHAFLTAGEVPRSAPVSTAPAAPSVPAIAVTLAAALAGYLAVAASLGITWQAAPARLALGAVLALGLAHLLMQARRGAGALARAAAVAAGLAAGYLALELGAEVLLAPVLPPLVAPGAAGAAVLAALVLGFAGLVGLQLRLPALGGSPRWRALYVHLRQGLYLDLWLDRLGAARW